MIARCPECQARYRIAPEKIGPRGARIQCSACQTVFRIPPPAEGAAAPSEAAAAPKPAARPAAPARAAGPVVLVAESDAAAGKLLAAALERGGFAVELVPNGADALLEIHRRRPACAVLGGHLAGMSGPVVCELVRRTAELAGVRLIRVAPLDEPVGAPEFEADRTLEPGDLPDGVLRLLDAIGLQRGASTPPPAARPAAAVPGPAAARAPVGDADHVAAERLARIIISDIILYNEEKFHAALREGTIATALDTELREAGMMFAQRVPEALRAKRNYLAEELMRRANKLLSG